MRTELGHAMEGLRAPAGRGDADDVRTRMEVKRRSIHREDVCGAVAFRAHDNICAVVAHRNRSQKSSPPPVASTAVGRMSSRVVPPLGQRCSQRTRSVLFERPERRDALEYVRRVSLVHKCGAVLAVTRRESAPTTSKVPLSAGIPILLMRASCRVCRPQNLASDTVRIDENGTCGVV